MTEEHPSPEAVAAVVQRARDALAAGLGGTSLQSAVDQLVADRTNGETVDAAYGRVLDELDRAAPPA